MLVASQELFDSFILSLDLAKFCFLWVVDHVGKEFAQEVDTGLRRL